MSNTREQTQPKGRVVFFSLHALGHIHPLVSIIRELRRRNYKVTLLTLTPIREAPRLEAMGIELDFCESPQNSSQDNNSKVSEESLRDVFKPALDGFRKGLRESYVSTYAPGGVVEKYIDSNIEKHDIIEAKLKSLQPDLVVFEHVVGLPCATYVAKRWVRFYSSGPTSLYATMASDCCAGLGLRPNEMTAEAKKFEVDLKRSNRDKIRAFFTAKGCPDWPSQTDMCPTSPDLNFYLGPNELESRYSYNTPIPKVWFKLEHTICDQQQEPRREFQIPAELERLPGKLIYFSMGTLISCDVELMNRLLDILSGSPNKFIVSLGQMFEQIQLHPNMWGERFIDQKAVLSKADLFITHGGHNSIIESFYYGVPGLIVLPVFADQFDNAQSVQDCNFGLRLDPYNCSATELLGSIEKLLANAGEYRERMQTIGSRLRSIKYHEIAAEKLEQLILTEADQDHASSG